MENKNEEDNSSLDAGDFEEHTEAEIMEVQNDAYDAEMAVIGSADESIETTETKSPSPKASQFGIKNVNDLKDVDENRSSSFDLSRMSHSITAEHQISQLHDSEVPVISEKQLIPSYDPDKYNKLNISKEVQDTFDYIARYDPHNIELGTKLMCFIPDYIPSTGNIDRFAKIIPPPMKSYDLKLDLSSLGLAVLDEPSMNQSDETVLQLQLRATCKSSAAKQQMLGVDHIEDPLRNKGKITSWISSVVDLQSTQPQMNMKYNCDIPDIEQLMEVWPEKLEQELRSGKIQLPSDEVDLSLEDYVKFALAVTGIPFEVDKCTYDGSRSLIQGLHALFMTYSAFTANQHFNS